MIALICNYFKNWLPKKVLDMTMTKEFASLVISNISQEHLLSKLQKKLDIFCIILKHYYHYLPFSYKFVSFWDKITLMTSSYRIYLFLVRKNLCSKKIASFHQTWTSLKYFFHLKTHLDTNYVLQENYCVQWKPLTCLFPMHPFSTPWKHQKILWFSAARG